MIEARVPPLVLPAHAPDIPFRPFNHMTMPLRGMLQTQLHPLLGEANVGCHGLDAIMQADTQE